MSKRNKLWVLESLLLAPFSVEEGLLKRSGSQAGACYH